MIDKFLFYIDKEKWNRAFSPKDEEEDDDELNSFLSGFISNECCPLAFSLVAKFQKIFVSNERIYQNMDFHTIYLNLMSKFTFKFCAIFFICWICKNDVCECEFGETDLMTLHYYVYIQ